MKHIYLMRHAKSDWNNEVLEDIERPLNKRGKKDAQRMAKFLSGLNIQPDVLLSSPAQRTRETVEIIVRKINRNLDFVQFNQQLYNFSHEPYLNVLKDVDDENSSIFLVGHNPSLEILSSFLLGKTERSIQLPTAAISRIDLELDYWSELDAGVGVLRWLVTPKILFTK